MKKSLIALAAIGFGLFVLISWGVGIRNTFNTLDKEYKAAWGQVENVLQRRSDLIPNLVNTVQAYAIHEQDVFIKVAEARNIWNKTAANPTAPIGERIAADRQLSGALFNMMGVVERYPELKANQNFLALQDELAGTENRISVERKRFNDAAKTYNAQADRIPDKWILGFTDFPKQVPFFQADEGATKAPKVNIQYPGRP